MKRRYPKYTHGFIDRHGHARFYFRRAGYKPVKLPGLPWSPTFMAAYEAALANDKAVIGASRTLPGDLTLAVEVGPTEPEYDTTCSGGPIIAYSDARCVYDKDVADALMAIATQRGLSPQAAVLGAFESDASHSKASGLSPQAGLLCLPTLSTHGYEVITRNAVAAVTDVLTGFLRRGFAAEPSGR